jgi:predicted ATP-dependent endonuclease of OLD family
MKINIKDFGPIKDGKIENNDLTIICGPNNSGKTYISYLFYAIISKISKNYSFNSKRIPKDKSFSVLNIKNKNSFKSLTEIKLDIKTLTDNYIENTLPKLIDNTIDNLHIFFNMKKEMLSNSNIKVNYTKKELLENFENKNTEKRRLRFINGPDIQIEQISKYKSKLTINPLDLGDISFNVFKDITEDFIFDYIYENIYSSAFLIPSIREGISIFFNELNYLRTINSDLFGENKNKKTTQTLFNNSSRHVYSNPINHYYNFLLSLPNNQKPNDLYKELAEDLLNILEGTFSIDSTGFYYIPKNTKTKLSLNNSSSIVKSLVGLYYYLLYYAKRGDIILIDEPEMNLHPDNQRKLAQFFAKMINSGLKVIISTHSDFIIREINNLMLLSQDFKGKEEIIKEHDYSENMILNHKKVNSYFINNGKIEKLKFDKLNGLDLKNFKDSINKIQDISDDIYYSIIESDDEEI